MSQHLLSSEEVKQYLGIDQKDIDKLVRSKKLTAYRLGGTYLRYPKDQVAALKPAHGKKDRIPSLGLWTQTAEFWHRNGFYFVSAGLLIAVLYFALQ